MHQWHFRLGDERRIPSTVFSRRLPASEFKMSRRERSREPAAFAFTDFFGDFMDLPSPTEQVTRQEIRLENGGARKGTPQQHDESGAPYRFFAPQPVNGANDVRQEYPLGVSVRRYCPTHGYHCPTYCYHTYKFLWPSPSPDPAPGSAKKNVPTVNGPADGLGKPVATGKSLLSPSSLGASPPIPSLGFDGGRSQLGSGYGRGSHSSPRQGPAGGGLGGAIGAALTALLGSIAWAGRKIKRAFWPSTNAQPASCTTRDKS